MYEGAHRLVQQVGVDILVVFLFIVGVVLLTGASLASAIRATGSGVVDTTRVLRAHRPRLPVPEALRETLRPPEPGPHELIVRAGTVAQEEDEEAPPREELLEAIDPWEAEPVLDAGIDDAAEAVEVAHDIEAESDAEADVEAEEADLHEEISGVAAARYGSEPADATRPPARGGHRRPRLRLGGATGRAAVDALQRRAEPTGHGGTGAHRCQPGRGAGPLRRAGQGDRHGRGAAHHPLRAAPGARHEGRQGRAAEGRPGLRAGGNRHPDPCADPRQAGRGRRGAKRQAANRAPGRRLPGAARRLVAAHGVAGQGRGRQGDRRGPGEDAAPARRRHHRRGQVRSDQRDALKRAAARHAARGAPGAGGSQAGGAQPLRVDPAPAHPCHHQPEDGRQRAAEPRARDGAALRRDVARAHPQPDRAEQGARGARAKRRSPTSFA